MKLPLFSAVRLTTNRYLNEGVGGGAIGFILDVYDDGYDVEFSRPEDGSTIALLFLTQTDIEPAAEVVLRSESASV
jgi:hypothetical protein